MPKMGASKIKATYFRPFNIPREIKITKDIIKCRYGMKEHTPEVCRYCHLLPRCQIAARGTHFGAKGVDAKEEL